MSNPDTSADLCFATISDLSTQLRTRALSPVELTEAVLSRIEQHDETMKVYITVTAEEARAQARQAEQEIQRGQYRGPLHGVTVSLKDNIITKGIRTSCASMVNPDWVPDEDATVYTRLREAGAILVGKATLMEYAFGLNPAYPEPINPWHPEKTSSGSTSGGAVGIATGMSHGTIGSDTGGSGRAPACVVGTVGLKATYGRVSRWGVVPLSFSLDHTTMMTRSVLDSALMLQATAGHDPKDENSAQVPVPDFSAKIGQGIRGMRIGYARGYTHEGFDPDVTGVIREAVATLRELGAIVEDVQMPLVQHSYMMVTAIVDSEAALVHYDHHRTNVEAYGDTGPRLLDLGNVIPATAYIRAQQLRKVMRDTYREIFNKYDVIVGPVMPMRPGNAGSWSTVIDGQELDIRTAGFEHTGTYNLIGVPAMSVPAGFSSEGTPIGFHIAGKWWDEATVLQVAHAFEQTTGWPAKRPPYPKEDA